jgi:quinol monooxygenase YgiN
MIIRTTRLNALPNKRQELTQTLKILVGDIRKKKGCECCYYFQDTQNENGYCLMEEWDNQAALDIHLQSHTYEVLLGAVNLLSTKPVIHFCTTESLECGESERK